MKIDIADIAKQNGKKGTIEIPQRPIPKIEAVQYFKELNKLTTAMREDIRKELIPALQALENQYTMDGYADQLTQLIGRLSLKYQNVTTLGAKQVSQKMVGSVSGKNQKAFNALVNAVLGVDLASVIADEGLEDFLEAQVNKNVALIKSIPDEYFKAIADAITKADTNE